MTDTTICKYQRNCWEKSNVVKSVKIWLCVAPSTLQNMFMLKMLRMGGWSLFLRFRSWLFNLIVTIKCHISFADCLWTFCNVIQICKENVTKWWGIKTGSDSKLTATCKHNKGKAKERFYACFQSTAENINCWIKKAVKFYGSEKA